MRKQYFLLHICLLFNCSWTSAQTSLVFDQVDVTAMQDQDQLASSTIQTIYQYYLDNQDKTPTEIELRDMPRTTSVPADLEEIYYDNVWLNIAQYCWLDGDHFSTVENTATSILIPDQSHGTLRLIFESFTGPDKHSLDARAMRSFDELPVIISKVKSNYYFVEKSLQNTEEADYQLIVNYQDGLLTYENTSSGNAGDFNSHRRFRYTAIGIPKSLLEQTNASNMPVIQSSLPLMQYDLKNWQWREHVKNTSGYSKPTLANKPAQHQKPVVINDEEGEERYEQPQAISNAIPVMSRDMLSQEQLKSLRPGKQIASGLAEDLYKFDWLEIGGLMWYQGEEYWNNGTLAPLYRFDRENGVKEYEIHVNNAGKKSPKYTTTLSDDSFHLVKRGNFHFITNGKEGDNRIEYTVLSYDGTILVYDEFDAVSGIRVRKVCKAVGKVG